MTSTFSFPLTFFKDLSACSIQYDPKVRLFFYPSSALTCTLDRIVHLLLIIIFALKRTLPSTTTLAIVIVLAGNFSDRYLRTYRMVFEVNRTIGLHFTSSWNY